MATETKGEMTIRHRQENLDLWHRQATERRHLKEAHARERAELKSPRSAAALRQRLEELNG